MELVKGDWGHGPEPLDSDLKDQAYIYAIIVSKRL